MNEVYEAFMLGGQEIEKLRKELQRKDNIINELKKWLEYEIYCDFSNEMTKAYQDSLDKINELESKGEENWN